MDYHEVGLCALRNGVVKIHEGMGARRRGERIVPIKIKRGLAKVGVNELVVMVET